MKKYIWIVPLIMLSILLLAECDTGTTTESSDINSPDNQYQKSAGLTDEQAIANAKKLCEENALAGQDNVFNLNYTGSSLETDGYNRYIVQLDYQYEKSNQELKKSSVYIYFSYDPDEDAIHYQKWFGCFTSVDVGSLERLKSDEDFAWGIDPATIAYKNAEKTYAPSTFTDGDESDIQHTAGNEEKEKKTLFDYIGGKNSIDGSVGDTLTVTGTIAQNSGIFPTWCIKLDSPLRFQETDGNGDTAYFDCDKLYLYDGDDFDGIPFLCLTFLVSGPL